MRDALFDIEPTIHAEPADENLSADRRRTIRQKTDVANGIHPLTRTRIHPDSVRTCGSCQFREIVGHGARSYPKCTYGGPTWPRATHSASSDVRAWWPGCRDHEHSTGETSA